MDRRELLKMIAVATGTGMIGIPTLVFAYDPPPPAHNAFSAADVAKLDEIAETILPRTKTPGAKDAGVGLYLAQFVTDCYAAKDQATFRAGLIDIDQRAGGRFVSLTPEARTQLLRSLDIEARQAASPSARDAADKTARKPHYFTMIKQLVIYSFFTSQVGATQVLRYVAVPGRYDGDMPYEAGTPAWAT